MFKIGDLVVHPMHGAGVIEDILEERVAGTICEYYVFRPHLGRMLLRIPVANSEDIGVRSIISMEEAERLLAEIPSMPIEVSPNWNKRYQENMARLKSGDLHEVARVVKGLMHRDSKRSLSTGERKMLQNAKQILLSEMVLAEESEYGEMEARVDQSMMQYAML